MPAASSSTVTISGLLRERIALARDSFDAWLRERERRRRVEDQARLQTPWQMYWGEAYGIELKEFLVKPLFESLETQGKIGDLIVDVGSGARPVTRFIQSRSGRKRILVDVAADNGKSQDEQRIRLNAEKIDAPRTLSFRKALLRVCRFLEIAPGSAVRRADIMVFADVLNYVDFRKVLRGFSSYLRRGGRLVIVNLPMRGNQALFSEKGLKDNRQLYQFLEEERFEIEQKSFPCRARDTTEEAEELIVLVARKCA
jgi:hypothetical protein